MKRQQCSIGGCAAPSVAGLQRGAGKCQYHWNAGVWGREWADHVRRMGANGAPPAAEIPDREGEKMAGAGIAVP